MAKKESILKYDPASSYVSGGIRAWIANEAGRRLFYYLWILAQIGYFIQGFIVLNTSPKVKTFRDVLGLGLGMARSAANVINLNSAVLLFTVCRNLISILRASFLNKIVPFDKNITFHINIAWMIVFWTYVHVVAHYVNYLNVQKAFGSDIDTGKLRASAWVLAVLSGPGLTGQVVTVALFLIVTSALEGVRRKYFEMFWYTHHLFIVFFGGLLLHGSFCFIKADVDETRIQSALELCRGGPTFWKWWIASGVFYTGERIFREIRGRRKTFISKVVKHPSKVIELQIKKPSCKTKAGQYVFVCCPEIAKFEWHPFTLTSTPYEDFISLHIRIVGDWTEDLARRCGCIYEKGDDQYSEPIPTSNLPYIMIDGPYGSASEDVFKREIALLVGAGIGVTPFASILKTIWYKVKNPNADKNNRLKKSFFVWVCREKEAFEWFQDLLLSIEEENLDGESLDVCSFLTGGLKIDELRNVIINDEEGIRDAITGLRSPTYFGRPNWDSIFSMIRKNHPDAEVGVYFCGPKVISRTLHRMCNKWTSRQSGGTRFHYGKENF